MTWNNSKERRLVRDPMLADLRRLAKHRGITIEYDAECQCYRATCPERMRFEDGLHEVVAVFGRGIIGNDATCAEARKDLYERLLEDVPKCEPCDDAGEEG